MLFGDAYFLSDAQPGDSVSVVRVFFAFVFKNDVLVLRSDACSRKQRTRNPQFCGPCDIPRLHAIFQPFHIQQGVGDTDLSFVWVRNDAAFVGRTGSEIVPRIVFHDSGDKQFRHLSHLLCFVS